MGTRAPDLFGRESEILAIEASLASCRLLTLTGPGGSGKTRLAQAIVERVSHAGAALVDLSTISAGEHRLPTVASALGLPQSADLDAAAAVAGWATEQPDRLLVLDNLEQVAGAGTAVSTILAAAPAVRVLATSRVPLGASGEREMRIGPLALPASDTATDVAASPAGAVFLATARAVGGLADLDEPTAAGVAMLCHRLDGLPLALELAAARTRVLSVAEIAERLGDREMRILQRADGNPRQRSLAQVIGWSVSLLADAERGVLEALSTATNRFDLDLAEAIAPAGDVVSALDSMVTFGLVQREAPVAGRTRFRILETVRAVTVTTDEEPRRRHAEAMLKRIEDAAPLIEDEGGTLALERLDADADDLWRAIRWSRLRDPDLGLALAATAYPYWSVRGQLREGVDVLIDLLREATPTAHYRARATGGVSHLLSQLGGQAAAFPYGKEAARLGRETGDVDAEIEGLQSIVWTAFERGDLVDREGMEAASARAMELMNEASPLRRFRARQVVLASLVHRYGIASDEVLGALDEAIADVAGGRRTVALAKLRGNRALNYVSRHDFGPAVADATQAVEVFRRVGDPYHENWALNTVMIAAGGVGDGALFAKASRRARELTVAGNSAYDLQDLVITSATAALLFGVDPVVAARLRGLAEALHEEPIDTMVTTWIWDRGRKQIGEVAWTLAVKDGQGRDALAALDEVSSLVATARVASPRAVPPALRHGTLTRREVEILHHLAAGRTDVEIAAALSISAKTASVHVTNIKAKLGLESRVSAALRAREMGFGP